MDRKHQAISAKNVGVRNKVHNAAFLGNDPQFDEQLEFNTSALFGSSL